MPEQLKTGIEGLDGILEGGIPKGHCVLLAGSCGTGKTVMCQQFLFDGARNGDNGVYISLVEPMEKIIKNMSPFGFYDQKLVDEGKVKIVDMMQDTRLRGIEFNNIEGLLGIIRSIIDDNEAERVVIDSVTALCENIQEKNNIRDFILELGFQLMYQECTTIMISEIPPQTFKYSVFGVEEFIADGVVLLSEFERKGELIRALQVIKMRGVAHSRNKHVMKILDEGINLIPMFRAGVE
ncbi:MAG: AAA family ATPase [Candidatus Altiarchaeales archaeon]|nr:AAA family ATPase [Candidatus Altiarchaeales archaeon]MBD3416930.1 AAA family ATPase [Candidatus Altiarchaeales archaeon]